MISFRKDIADFRNPKFKVYKLPEFVRARRIDKYIIELEEFISELMYLNNDSADPKKQIDRFIEVFQTMDKKQSKVLKPHREFVAENTLETLLNDESLTNANIIDSSRNNYFYQEQLYKYDYYYKLCSEGIRLSSK